MLSPVSRKIGQEHIVTDVIDTVNRHQIIYGGSRGSDDDE